MRMAAADCYTIAVYGGSGREAGECLMLRRLMPTGGMHWGGGSARDRSRAASTHSRFVARVGGVAARLLDRTQG